MRASLGPGSCPALPGAHDGLRHPGSGLFATALIRTLPSTTL